MVGPSGTSAFDGNLNDGLLVFKYKQLNTIVGNVDVGWHTINDMKLLKLPLSA